MFSIELMTFNFSSVQEFGIKSFAMVLKRTNDYRAMVFGAPNKSKVSGCYSTPGCAS
jgi:hypothetical protein